MLQALVSAVDIQGREQDHEGRLGADINVVKKMDQWAEPELRGSAL